MNDIFNDNVSLKTETFVIYKPTWIGNVQEYNFKYNLGHDVFRFSFLIYIVERL